MACSRASARASRRASRDFNSIHRFSRILCTTEPRSRASNPQSVASIGLASSRLVAKDWNGQAAWRRSISAPPAFCSIGQGRIAACSSSISRAGNSSSAARYSSAAIEIRSAFACILGVPERTSVDGRQAPSAFCVGKLKTHLGALLSRRVVTCWASFQSAVLSAWGMLCVRCSDRVRKGWGRATAGQPASSAPRNHSASKVRPAASNGPRIWTAASRDSGAKIVCPACRSSTSRNSE